MLPDDFQPVWDGFYGQSLREDQKGVFYLDMHYSPKESGHTITSYALAENNFVGQVKEEQKNYDLLSVFMICLGNPEAEIGCGILKLLSVLFSSELKAEEKKKVLEEEFHIQMSQAFEEEVSNMCN